MTSSYEEHLNAITAKSEEFAKLLTNIQIQNDELRAKSTKVLESITDLVGRANINTCKVCMNRPQTHMLYPCGHAGFCLTCATRAKDDRGRCFQCRQRIVDVVKYYL